MSSKTDAFFQILALIFQKFPALIFMIFGGGILMYPINAYYLDGLLPKLFIASFYSITSITFAIFSDIKKHTRSNLLFSNFVLYLAILWQFLYMVNFGIYRRYPYGTCGNIPKSFSGLFCD